MTPVLYSICVRCHICMYTLQFQRLIQNRELHENDVEMIMARTGDVLTPLLDMLYEKAFIAHQVSVTGLSHDHHQACTYVHMGDPVVPSRSSIPDIVSSIT